MKNLASALYFSVAALLALSCITNAIGDPTNRVSIWSQAILCAINVFMGVVRLGNESTYNTNTVQKDET